MAECGKVNVNCERVVCKIHEKLKTEIHQLAEKRSWSLKQKEEFKKKLIELYRDTVEESVKRNVSIDGKDWSNSVAEQEINSVHEEMEPVNGERLAEVNKSWGDLEELIRDTTSKRKHYPPQMTQALRKTLQCRKEMTEMFEPIIKSDPSLPMGVALDRDAEKNLRATVSEVSQLPKSFTELQGKAARLHQAMQSHMAMQECETNAVLFRKDRKTPCRNTESEAGTTEMCSTRDIVKSIDISKSGRKKPRKPGVTRKSNIPRYAQK